MTDDPQDIVPKTLHSIRQAWCAETSCNPPAWSAETPSKDQCAVSACLIQDLLGLKVIRGKAHLPDGSTDSHYWNEGMDLTRDQFPAGTRVEEAPLANFQDAYDYCMSNPDTRRRYDLLKERVALFS